MTRFGRRALLAACAGSLLAGCSGRVPGGNDTRTGTDGSETPRTSATPASTGGVEIRWDTFVPGQYSLSAPAVADGALYLGSRKELRSLALDDGTVQWETPLGALTHAFSPAVADGVAYAGARDMVGRELRNDEPGAVAALTTADGSERWRTDARITGSPAVADGTLLVPTTDGKPVLRAFAAADGSERWHATLAGAGGAFARPVVADGLALAGTVGEEGGRLVALDIADGTEAWALDLAGSVQAAPAVADGVAYLGTDAGDLLALSVADGTEQWRVAFDRPVRTSPAVTDGAVYVATGDAARALAAADGAEEWRATVSSVSRTGLTVGDGTVYAGGQRITAVAAADGSQQWIRRLDGLAGTFGAPVYRDGVLYTGACIKQDGNDPYDHHVYALAETE